MRALEMGFGIWTRIAHKYWEVSGRLKWFGVGYHGWQSKRVRAMLDHYGHQFFAGKKVVELGAGYGDIGGFFAMLGADVTCLEGREINVAEIRRRYPAVKARQFDLNEPLPVDLVPTDFIIHFGVLYHLRDPEASLRNTCRGCKEMVLETECADSDDPNFTKPTSEHSYHKDHALDGVGCNPSAAFIERILREEGMAFEMIKDARCNAGDHHYDWPVRNTGAGPKGQRRLWFVKRKV
ncbi:MAG TPA: methyltransferase domain-containing protein [Verrucomicrobiae bacterium]|jgi:hypothetical protein|nr:methyltransferase domain-containing protein [Verrucomicrobiae bacterium]